MSLFHGVSAALFLMDEDPCRDADREARAVDVIADQIGQFGKCYGLATLGLQRPRCDRFGSFGRPSCDRRSVHEDDGREKRSHLSGSALVRMPLLPSVLAEMVGGRDWVSLASTPWLPLGSC